MSDKLANTMPNGLLKVAETQTNKNILNNFANGTIKRIFNPKLAPSAGSLTENFLKARSNNTPLYMNNEASTKYEMISASPVFLKQIKRNVDLFV
jgi:hypothetical protein